MKTQEQYLKSYSKCPACNSDQTEGQSVDFQDNWITQQVICLDCNGSWCDEYKLQGYSDFEADDS